MSSISLPIADRFQWKLTVWLELVAHFHALSHKTLSHTFRRDFDAHVSDWKSAFPLSLTRIGMKTRAFCAYHIIIS